MRVVRLWLVLFVLSSVTFAAATPPNIILITLDTVRADRVGFLESKLGLTPNLDALSRNSFVFTHAYSQVPLTAPSHATILTGTYPQLHQVQDFQTLLAKDLPFAPDILHSHGYHTAAFVGGIVLDPSAGLAPGFDRGFDTYDAGFHEREPGEDRYSSEERRGGEVVAHALAWLKLHPKGPFFMWVHLYDPHDPYDPPEPYKSKYSAAPYNGEIAYADAMIGKLLVNLRVRGLYDTSIIAVMSDHGESLGAHGEEFHGFFLYDETIHVPLLIKLPVPAGKQPFTKKKVDGRVELTDVLPTLLEAAGIPIPPQVQGKSLLGMMKTTSTIEPASDRAAYSETEYGHRSYGWASLHSLRTGKYLYIDAPKRELYDQSADPKADNNLVSTASAVAGTLATQLDAFMQSTTSTRESPKLAVDPDAQKKLAALGYAASASNETKAGSSSQGADPKDKIEIGNMIHHANFLAEEGNMIEAVPLFEQLIAKEPGMLMLYDKLSQCLLRINDYPRAVPILRKLVELRPDSNDARLQLATALLRLNDFSGAIPELEKVVEASPGWDRGHLLLATAYIHANRFADAIKQCNAVLQLAPDHYPANLLLGRALLLSGDAEAALPRLKKAAELQPEAPEPHLALSNAYTKLGRAAEAQREQEEAKRLSGGA